MMKTKRTKPTIAAMTISNSSGKRLDMKFRRPGNGFFNTAGRSDAEDKQTNQNKILLFLNIGFTR